MSAMSELHQGILGAKCYPRQEDERGVPEDGREPSFFYTVVAAWLERKKPADPVSSALDLRCAVVSDHGATNVLSFDDLVFQV